ncbi:hypothetical protein [Pectobacterium aroidearum]|uniref:hypothetical protein n=1 Tax=Pectobacterium aroidearum TaxID=1201031 RepID=UPI002114C061|nr:hypothetical protein [Pectobacterium aroidearum]UUE71108.1 hypothetical protein L0Y21_03635 [Pectobacterium aroidearum]UUE71504.1 hypothetical protein L0Y21_05795 [Pectobacterium aroidearum]UUE71572.1 hypothetical protein L0Y21_06175 [Pectobacterium aroidearum]UUE75506.1 hypothetical protein L0Y20_03750 [Pectobacterium aroidearum]UUE75905.1 hypothetical protein L0Y20_05915 [Pectobacterium aroidearum]
MVFKQALAGFWSAIWPYLIAVAVALVCYEAGKREGRSAAQLEQSQAEIQQAANALNDFIVGTRDLTANANIASQQLAQQINARQAADEQSTEAIRAALKKTAELRVMCEFDADVMQQLDAARERAASAATTGIASSTSSAVRSPGGRSQ